MAVDNDHFAAKLHLRRHFLHKYHTAAPPRVFDACQATGQLWKALRADFAVSTYFGVDLALQPGRLRVDSARVLATPGWSFDVVDIDTYGTPWGHWRQVLTHGRTDMTVFLTMGKLNNTQAPLDLLLDMGMGRIARLMPEAFRMRLYERAVVWQIGLAAAYGFRVVEALEAPRGKRALYFGVRLERVEPIAPHFT